MAQSVERTPSEGAQSKPPIFTSLTYSTYLWNKRWILAPFVVASVAAYIWAVRTLTLVDPVTLFFFAGGSLCLVLYVLLGQFESRIFRAFASIHGFQYRPAGTLASRSAIIFQVGEDGRFSDIVTGECVQLPFAAFVYRYSVPTDRRNRHLGNPYAHVVMTLNFGQPLLSFVMCKTGALHAIDMYLTEGRTEVLAAQGYTQQLRLEGNFNRYFSLYIRPNTENGVLSLLTPDVMELLLQVRKYEIELSDDGTFFVYSDDYLTEQQELESMYRFLSMLASKISQHAAMQRWIS